MIIDFKKIEFEKKQEYLGGHKSLYVRSVKDSLNNIMCNRLEVGASIGYHKHEKNSEIIYLIKGQARVLCDNAWETLKEGECHYCPKGHSHSLINDSDTELVFFAVICEQ